MCVSVLREEYLLAEEEIKKKGEVHQLEIQVILLERERVRKRETWWAQEYQIGAKKLLG